MTYQDNPVRNNFYFHNDSTFYVFHENLETGEGFNSWQGNYKIYDDMLTLSHIDGRIINIYEISFTNNTLSLQSTNGCEVFNLTRDNFNGIITCPYIKTGIT